MDLLLLPLSKTVHLIGLLRSEQSSPLINVDVALTLSLNVAGEPCTDWLKASGLIQSLLQ
jgi:hypothetical protein